MTEAACQSGERPAIEPARIGEADRLAALVGHEIPDIPPEVAANHRDTSDRTRDKYAALGRIAGDVAHELNNLLQPIIGLTQLELDQLPSDGNEEQMESRENLTIVLESGNQAREVVRKLLLFAHKAKPELTLVEFPIALRRAIASLREQLPPSVYVDQLIDDSAVGFARINEADLAEIMINLALNAADAMNGNGALTIRCDRLVLSEKAASLGIAAGPCFRLSVADTGHGLDADTMARVFEPFFTTRPVGQRTGLGLSMVHRALRDWKGAVAVDSTTGSGSTFALYIPALETA